MADRPLTADELQRMASQHLPASVCECTPQPCAIDDLLAEIERLRRELANIAELATQGTAADLASPILRDIEQRARAALGE